MEIETTRVRHTWVKSQLINGEATPGLLKLVKETLDELAALRANDLEMERAGNRRSR